MCNPGHDAVAPGARQRNHRLAQLDHTIVGCTACPRLVEWRSDVAEPGYWGRPVPGFGPSDARIYVLGLATAAHGGNRTGRAFSGNPTADLLVRVLHANALANQPTSTGPGDGLELRQVRLGSAVRCPPPANRPTALERNTCAPFLREELDLLGELRVVLALGGFAWTAAARLLDIRPRPRFGHGAEADAGRLTLLGSYHPSRQNTSTGVLTAAMLDTVVRRARVLAGLR